MDVISQEETTAKSDPRTVSDCHCGDDLPGCQGENRQGASLCEGEERGLGRSVVVLRIPSIRDFY